MQLVCETLTIEQAIAELERAIPIAGFIRVIESREQQHKPRASLRRRLELLRAEQLRQEARNG